MQSAKVPPLRCQNESSQHRGTARNKRRGIINSRRIAEETNPIETIVKTVLLAILAGVGIAIGFHIVQTKLRTK